MPSASTRSKMVGIRPASSSSADRPGSASRAAGCRSRSSRGSPGGMCPRRTILGHDRRSRCRAQAGVPVPADETTAWDEMRTSRSDLAPQVLRAPARGQRALGSKGDEPWIARPSRPEKCCPMRRVAVRRGRERRDFEPATSGVTDRSSATRSPANSTFRVKVERVLITLLRAAADRTEAQRFARAHLEARSGRPIIDGVLPIGLTRQGLAIRRHTRSPALRPPHASAIELASHASDTSVLLPRRDSRPLRVANGPEWMTP